ncbi:hypothetical protein BKA70DRAFT_676054 [Coprinopsis sp. MPI-PUGE-AT-0042]|nr:hypothetical protein BKA70DRAFT_676054 [Coprinopsis sp. MPI-PUGE-AT-0042]
MTLHLPLASPLSFHLGSISTSWACPRFRRNQLEHPPRLCPTQRQACNGNSGHTEEIIVPKVQEQVDGGFSRVGTWPLPLIE